MVTISEIAYALRTASASTADEIKLSQAQQLVAAAFGYKSLAAYQASEEEIKDLEDATHFVLDESLLCTRSRELALPHQFADLVPLLRTAFKERHRTARLHLSESELHEYVRSMVQGVVLNNDNAAGAMAMTNNDGIDEIYLPIDDLVLTNMPAHDVFDMEFEGHVTVTPDFERPYSRHRIDVNARLILQRKGRACIAAPLCEVISARLSYDWGNDDDDNAEEEANKVSLAKALADELDLSFEEAGELVDFEAQAVESNDGLVYRYIYDFDHAPRAIGAKLMAKYGTLQVEVPSWFFDRVHRTFD